MKRLKLFPKIFLYTFLVILFVMILAHVFLYILSPKMILSTNSFLEGGVYIENSLNTEALIKTAILKALPFSLVCCTVISLLCSLLFSKAMTTPIKQISKVTEQMEKLDKLAQCPVNSADEIGTLAIHVNMLYTSLLSTIEKLEEEKRKVREAEKIKIDFLRMASHELKTPVTALNAILENMVLGVVKPNDRDGCLLECKEIAGHLSSMIREILDTSRLDFMREKQTAEKFDVSDILPKLCEPYQLISKAKQLDFHLEIREKCPVCLSRKSFEKILSNLLSNAVAYTQAGKKVTVILRANQICVENECTPIPAEKLPRLFEPFYRPDFARDRRDGGNGLGLYIVDTLSKAMGIAYSFEAMSSPPGMRFTLLLF